MEATVPNKRTGSLLYPLLQKAPITEAITPRRDNTNTVLEPCGASAERLGSPHITSRFRPIDLIPF